MKHFSYICLFLLAFSSCSLRAVREAQDVVAEADSLWAAGQMYGRDSGDSATLAQAYEQLGNLSPLRFPLSVFSFPLSASYAHSCYHYGRLLRNNDDPVAAMQAFINATHSHTRDYHILGRVYSNMGELAHMAGEFQLSYEMFERCANMYLHNDDSLLCYYGLYRMAYENAVLAKKDDCFLIIDSIIKQNINDDVLMSCCYLTKSKAYYMCHQYDSSIYYANLSLQYNPHESTGILLLAQNYSYLSQNDSSVYYAKQVLNYTSTLSDQNNALYILSNKDLKQDVEYVRQISANRADIQKQLEIRQGKLSQAIQLLNQDLNRKPDLRWLYAIIATLVLFSIVISCYVHDKRKKHTLISQKVEDLKAQTSETQKQHLQLLQEHQIYANNKRMQIEQTCLILRSSDDLFKELQWKNYTALCKFIDEQFYFLATKLNNCQSLNEQEIRLCILVLLDIPRNQIANILLYAQNGIGKFKYRVAQKLGTEGKNLRNFLINLAIGESNI